MSASSSGDDFLAEILEGIKEEQRKSYPDYSIVVYCDKHLRVRMRLAVSLTVGEYGEASANVNHLTFWRCPKPGCERCYEPTMFGYFWYGSEMGSRIEPNPEKQPRGNHNGEPFRYIGRVGQGRRYLCPLYKCTEQGAEVSPFVVDEEIETPKDPLDGLRKEERKRVIEMTVFKAFALASALPIDQGSETNEEPPNPDIRCTISGKLHWFELGQIISPDVAAKINPKRRTSEGGFSFDQEIPFVDIVTKKATKKYETQGAPVDLILHFDLRLGSMSVVQRQIEKHAELLKSLVIGGPFARVWIFDEWKKTIVWSAERFTTSATRPTVLSLDLVTRFLGPFPVVPLQS